MASRIQVRRDTADNWTTINPVLAEGELALELDTGFVKFGDGVTPWIDLSYFSGDGFDPADLADVARTGQWADIANRPVFSPVATSGQYDHLSGRPSLGTAAAASTTDFATAAQGAKADTAVQPAALANKADLDGSGHVPVAQLPSFVSDVIEVASYDDLPATGESGNIYVTINTNKSWRWTGSTYVEIGDGGVGLGTTPETAHRGDHGVIAYQHVSATGNPHDTAPADIGAATAAQGDLADTAVQPGDLSPVATTGSYNDLTDTPSSPGSPEWGDIGGDLTDQADLTGALGAKADTASLAPVASTGDYGDLNGTPTLGTAASADTGDFATAAQGQTADAAVQPGDLSAVATTGSYNDLIDTPAAPGAPEWGDIGGTLTDQADLSGALDAKADTSSLAPVATTGSYNDLTDTPVAPGAPEWGDIGGTLADQADLSGALGAKTDDADLSPVAKTGDYGDLTGTPTIPSTPQEVGADPAGTAAGLVGGLAPVASTGSYSDLTNTPPPLDDASDISVDPASWEGEADNVQDGLDEITATFASTLSGLDDVAWSGDYGDLSNTPTLGTAAAADTGDFATAAQGQTADTALQPDDLSATGLATYDDGTQTIDVAEAAVEGIATDAINDLPVLTGGDRITVDDSEPGFLGIGFDGADVQTFTEPGVHEWVKPDGATLCIVTLIGGGGGGGSGRRGAAGTDRAGGGGGGGGCAGTFIVPAAILGATEDVTIGAGGPGGAAQTTDDQNGQHGTAGGRTSIGGIEVDGGGTGFRGEATPFAAGAGVKGSMFPAGGGGSSATLEYTAERGSGGHCGGGGGGASIAADDSFPVLGGGNPGGGALVGVTPSTPDTGAGGAGGKGGSHNVDGTLDPNGKNGVVYGGGGGGGGASLNGYASGAGGDGADGYLRIVTI